MPKSSRNCSATSRSGDCSRANARSLTLTTGMAPPSVFQPVIPRPAHERLVAHGENDAVLARAVLDPGPGRRREGVAEFPVEGLVADARATLTAHHDVDRVRGAAITAIAPCRGPCVPAKRECRHRR